MSLALPAIAPAYIHSSVKRRKNVWYSVLDGNWSDPNTWMSNALSYAQWNFNYPGQSVPSPIFPAVGDDVYINHAVTADVSVSINNLYGNGTLNSVFIVSGFFKTLTVNGDIQITGTVDFTGSNTHLVLMGIDNYIVNFIGGSSGSYVQYSRTGDQPVMNLPYNNLTIRQLPDTTISFGTKYLTGNTVVNGNLEVVPAIQGLSGVLECGNYDLTVNGTTSIGPNGIFRKSGSGNILLVGLLSNNNPAIIDFSGNPNIEFRGGITAFVANAGWNFGTGVVSFTTNNQNVSSSNVNANLIMSNVSIVGITVTNISSTGAWQINSFIDGTTSGSGLINKGKLYFNTTTAPMATFGTFDYTTYATNTLGYIMNGAFTVPYTTLTGSLYIAGTGTKILSGTTSIGTNLSIDGTLDLTTYDLTVTGQTLINSGGILNKTGAGSLLFIGLFQASSGSKYNFSGNPTVEFRNNIVLSGGSSSGTGQWIFSTNNKNFGPADSGAVTIDAPILISGAITVTSCAGSPTNNSFILNGSINGNNASSKFDNRCNRAISNAYNSAVAPMITGILECNAAANIWNYLRAGGQDVAGATYRTIQFGNSGVKTLQGNVVVNASAGGSQSTTGSASVNLNSFTITTI